MNFLPKIDVPGNLNARNKCINYLQKIWISVMILSILALFLKITFATFEAESGQLAFIIVIKAIVILFLLYVLFMTEGMMLSAIQIRSHDIEKVYSYIKLRYENTEHRIGSVVARFQNSYEEFAVGRQFISLFCVVGVVFLINSIDVYKSEHIRPFLESVLPENYKENVISVGVFIYGVLRNNITTFLIATLLPCWICQLLAHFCVEDRGIGFLRLPLSRTIADLSVRISKVQAGWPTFWIVDFFNAKQRIAEPERISAGDESIFFAAADYQGCFIDRRSVGIADTDGGLTVSDRSIYRFVSGKTDDLQHSVKVMMLEAPSVRLIGWDYRYPDGLKHAEEIKGVFLRSTKEAESESDSERNGEFHRGLLESGGAEDDAGSIEGNTGSIDEFSDAGDSTSSNEMVFFTQLPFHMPLPRDGRSSEDVEVSVTYSLDRLDTSDTPNIFIFEISKPTKLLVVTVQSSAENLIRPPVLGTQSAVEMPDLAPVTIMPESRYQSQMLDDGWAISIPYPPIGSRIIFKIDARVSR